MTDVFCMCFCMFVHAHVEKRHSRVGLCTGTSTRACYGGKESGKRYQFPLLNLAAARRESLSREVREVDKATWAESGIKTKCRMHLSGNGYTTAVQLRQLPRESIKGLPKYERFHRWNRWNYHAKGWKTCLCKLDMQILLVYFVQLSGSLSKISASTTKN